MSWKKILSSFSRLLRQSKQTRTTGQSKPTGILSKMATPDNGIDLENVFSHIMSQLEGHKFRTSVESHIHVVKSKLKNTNDNDEAKR